ncbi:hypothetical protein ACSQ67_023440 [Phaseolus vulgaris]
MYLLSFVFVLLHHFALPFFFQGTASFLLGLFFIFVRWPIIGIILEIYGFVVLFSGFWSSIKMFLYHIPVVGWVIQFICPP